MINHFKTLFVILALSILVSCITSFPKSSDRRSLAEKDPSEPSVESPVRQEAGPLNDSTVKTQYPERVWRGDYNVEIIVEEGIFQNPDQDTLGFYRLYIDKSEEMRTNIALRSQKRYWRGSLSADNHLIQLERWELNRESQRYERARNVLQPKPASFYFIVRPQRLLKVKIGLSEQDSTYERRMSYFPGDIP